MSTDRETSVPQLQLADLQDKSVHRLNSILGDIYSHLANADEKASNAIQQIAAVQPTAPVTYTPPGAGSLSTEYVIVGDITELTATLVEEGDTTIGVKILGVAPSDELFAGGEIFVEVPTEDDVDPADPTLPGFIDGSKWWPGAPDEVFEAYLRIPRPKVASRYIVYVVSRTQVSVNPLVRITQVSPPLPANYSPFLVIDVTPAAVGTIGENILDNPGFERGLAGWSGMAVAAGFDVVTTTYDTGSKCLKVSALEVCEIHQPASFEDGAPDVLPCNEGDMYDFTGRYKFDVGSTVFEPPTARVAFYDATGAFIAVGTGMAVLDTSKTDWESFSITATAPATAKYMGFFPWFGHLTAGAIYIDTLRASRLTSPGFTVIADATINTLAASIDTDGIHVVMNVTGPADLAYAGGHVFIEVPPDDEVDPADPVLPGLLSHVDWFPGEPGEVKTIEFTIPLPSESYLAALPVAKTVRWIVYHLSRAYQYANPLVRVTDLGPPVAPVNHTPAGDLDLTFTDVILALQDQLGNVNIYDAAVSPSLDGGVTIDVQYNPPQIGGIVKTLGTFKGVTAHSSINGQVTESHGEFVYEGNQDPVQPDAIGFAKIQIPMPTSFPVKVVIQLPSYAEDKRRSPQKIAWDEFGDPVGVPSGWGVTVTLEEANFTFDADPTAVDTTVLYDDFEQFAVQVGWVAPVPQDGVVGYEAAMEFYEAPFTTPHLFARMGAIQGYDTLSQTSPYKPKPTVATKVKGYVRSFTADGRYSDWIAGDLEDINLNLSVNVPQPAVGNWAIVDPTELNGGYGADQRQQKARLRVNVIAIPSGVDYVTAWLYMDGAWRPMLNADTTGNHDIWIDQPKTATTYDCKLVGNRREAIKLPSAANDVKTFSVAAWALPAALTGFTVTLESKADAGGNGKTLHRLKYAVTATTDPNRMGVAIFERWTDSAWNPISGADGEWKEVSWIKSTANSLEWYSSNTYDFPAPKTTAEYKQFAAVPKNYADEYDFGSALTQNTTFSPDGGWKATALDGSTLNGLEISGGKLQPKLDPLKGLVIDGSGNLTPLALTELERWGLNATDFDGSTPGSLRLNNAVIARLLTQYITLTGEMRVIDSGGTRQISVNSSRILVGDSSQYVSVESSGVTIKGGGAENLLTSTGMEIKVGGVSKVLVASGVTSINGGFQVNTSGTVYFEVAAGAIDCRLLTKIHSGFEYIAGGVTIAAGGKSDWRTALGLVIGTDVAAQSHTHDYAASSHTHDYAASSHTHAWSSITDKPTTFAPSYHTHSFSVVTGGRIYYPESYSEAIALSGITTAGWIPAYDSGGGWLGKIPYFT